MRFSLKRDNEVKKINCTQKELGNKIKKNISKYIIFLLLGANIGVTILYCKPFICYYGQRAKYTIDESIYGDKLITDDREDLLNQMQQILENEFDSNLLHNYYANIKDLNYHNNTKDIFKDECSGYYDSSKNRIVEIYYNKNVFCHEFTHLISSDGTTSGFKKNNIGHGLTEGYTAFFNHKYFEFLIGDDKYNEYLYESSFAQSLVNIIGLDKMNEAFLTANQNILIDELVKIYGEKEDAYELLKSIDKINLAKSEEEKSNYAKEAYDKLLNYGLGIIIRDIKFSENGQNTSKEVMYHYMNLEDVGTTIGMNDKESDKILYEKVVDYCLYSTDKYKYNNSKVLTNLSQNYVIDYEQGNIIKNK